MNLVEKLLQLDKKDVLDNKTGTYKSGNMQQLVGDPTITIQEIDAERLMELQTLPLDKAGRLIASLSRTKVYKDRVKQDMRRKADIAFREMESEMLKVIKQDEKSAAQLKEILAKAKERMMEDD